MLSLSLPLPLFPGLFRTVAGIGFKVHLVFLYHQWEKSNAPPWANKQLTLGTPPLGALWLDPGRRGCR